jgi:hypothetical protein
LNPEERLAAVVWTLEAAALSCLVMGGHAVRHYGLQRHTNDFDLAVAPEGWGDLPDRLAGSGLFPGAARRPGQPDRVRRRRTFPP